MYDKAAQHRYYEKHKLEFAERARLYYNKNKEKVKLQNKEYIKKYFSNDKNKRKFSIWANRYRNNQRAELLSILGNRCASTICLVPGGCHDTRCLQIDHINGGGNRERKRMRGQRLIVYYLSHPDEARIKLQILCANCNWIKRYENKEHLKRHP